MGVEHAKSNYYLIAGLLVIIGILVLVAICICAMNLKRILNVFRKSDAIEHEVENSTELQEIRPLTSNVDVQNSSYNFPSNNLPELSPTTYTETTSV